jgi:hypothetical protein
MPRGGKRPLQDKKIKLRYFPGGSWVAMFALVPAANAPKYLMLR